MFVKSIIGANKYAHWKVDFTVLLDISCQIHDGFRKLHKTAALPLAKIFVVEN